MELHGDTAEDFALLLSCIYDPEMYVCSHNICTIAHSYMCCRSLTFEHHDPDTPIAVSGVVRLADKYFLEPLRKRLVTQVADDWPTTLREWDIHQAEIKAITDAGFTRFDDPAERGPPLCDVIPEPASAIVFAQEFGCPEILPAAFYQLLQIHIKHDWSMQPVHKPAGPGPYPWCPLALARWGLLDKDNLARYVHGLHAAEDYVPDVLSFVSRGCIPGFHEGWESDPTSSCFLYVQNMLDVLGNRKGIRGARDPLRWLADCLHRDRFPELSERYPKGLCEHCWSALSNQVPRERQRIWRELLPKWFQLE